MSENKYKIVRQSVTIEPVKPTLKERVTNGIIIAFWVILGIASAIGVAFILGACNS